MQELFEAAVAKHHAGELQEAQRLYEKVIVANPNHYQSYNNLGGLLQQQNQWEEAISFFQKAVEVNPAYVEAYMNLAKLLHQQGQLRETIYYCQKLLFYKSDHQEAGILLSASLYELGDFAACEACLKALIRQNPRNGIALHNLGCLYYVQKKLDLALQCFKEAVSLGPLYAESCYYLGNTLYEQGKDEAAIGAYRNCLEKNPNHVQAQWNLANTLLSIGQWREGFALYEVRWELFSVYDAFRLDRNKKWQGESLDGKTILVFAEQGLGDTIQFIRYIPRLAQWQCNCIVAVQPSLVSLLQRSLAAYPFVQVISNQPDTMGKYSYDYFAAFLSLPYLFGTMPTTVPPNFRVLPPAKETAWWSENLSKDKIRVGLVWAGNPDHVHDAKRSCAFQNFTPLLSIEDAVFYSLQLGKGRDQLQCLDQEKVIDLANKLNSFEDTAAVIYNLDLIITVDTAVCHLAAALEKPTWLLLYHHQHDWRWELEEGTSPWYDKVRLYRQAYPGNWQGCLEIIRKDLQAECQRWIQWKRAGALVYR